MTECTPRPESFPILQPSQSKHSCLPYILLSGWPHQSFDSLLSSPLSWLLLWWEPSHRTAGEPAGCFPASGCPCPRCGRWTDRPQADLGGTSLARKPTVVPCSHCPKSQLLGPSSEALDNWPQPVCFCSAFPYSPYPRSAHESAKLA